MLERNVAQHYTHGSLGRVIHEGLARLGKDAERLDPADLAPLDEFHIGHRAATIHLAEQVGIRRGTRLCDIGCGLGGASRYFAGVHGCRVDGIDITPEYVEVAGALARRTGLEELVAYQVASAVALPFAAGTFDGAYLLHVGMNLDDKGRVFAEVARVLQPGGWFGIYDVMRTGEGEIGLPLPWATTAETNCLADVATYRRLAEAAGFRVEKQNDRREFAIDFFERLVVENARESGPPPFGPHVLLGAPGDEMIANMIAHLKKGTIAPVELVCVSARTA